MKLIKLTETLFDTEKNYPESICQSTWKSTQSQSWDM